jgi:hypothetical protein
MENHWTDWADSGIYHRAAPRYSEGEGKVTFTRTDGLTVEFDNVDYDSISAVATNNGVIAFNYFETDNIVHVPFVQSWVVTY